MDNSLGNSTSDFVVHAGGAFPAACVILDGGTTRTRGWAMRGLDVIAEARLDHGARDTTRARGSETGTTPIEAMVAGLCDAIARVGSRATCAFAGGMLTSAEGLALAPHVPAPADARAIALGARRFSFASLPDLPVWLFPGVRRGPERFAAHDDVLACDVMRGEELLALGLATSGRLAADATLLSLGSHWKAISVDDAGRVTGSVSTLSGELLQAVIERTILASSLPAAWPTDVPDDALAAGARAAARAGVARALYGVRLLDLRNAGDERARFAFALGALIESDRTTLVPDDRRAALLVGDGVVARAWERTLVARGTAVRRLSNADAEAAFRAGVAAVFAAAR